MGAFDVLKKNNKKKYFIKRRKINPFLVPRLHLMKSLKMARSRKRVSGQVNQEAAKKQPRRPAESSSSSATPKPAKSKSRLSRGKNGAAPVAEDEDSHLQPSTSSGSPSNSSMVKHEEVDEENAQENFCL